MLPERDHDESRQQRAKRLSEVPADLKQALREAVPAARSRAGDARRLGVEHGAADADKRHRQQDQQIGIGESQQHQADQREGHARRQDEIHRPLVQAHPDHRLKEGGGELEDESDEADLEKAQREALTEDRIKRRGERLHDVVQHVRGAECDEYANRRRPHRRDGLSWRRQRMSAQSSQALSPGRASRFGAGPKNSGRQKRPYVRYARIMSAPAPHCQFGGGYFLSETFKRP